MTDVTATSGVKVKSPRHSISVRQKHIDDSIEKRSSHCMIAQAVKEAIPEARFVSVDISTIRYTDISKGLRYTYLTPRSCQIAIIYYDRGDREKLHPFQFQLRTAMITQSALGSTWAAARERNRNVLGKKKKEKRVVLGRKKLSTEPSKNTGRVPHVIGGQAPPRMGTRREFGLRVNET